ncbi:MAG: hypothetical protein IT306_05535 [Chloroflexi bacterium]|nr:hypothetical protein [Chloroflexota bacterium]
MMQTDNLPVVSALTQAAESIISEYPALPAVATDRAIALLALWAADAIAAGRLAPVDADTTFTRLFVALGDVVDGPEIAESAGQLLLEGMTLHDWGTPFSGNLSELRRLAFGILTPAV